jgi:hypothetical protein
VLDDEEIMATVTLQLVAGYETTTNLIRPQNHPGPQAPKFVMTLQPDAQ